RYRPGVRHGRGRGQPVGPPARILGRGGGRCESPQRPEGDPMTQTSRVLLEVAVASVEDALAAQGGGADRLEVNAALGLGGLTPSLGTLIEVRAAVARPLLVMVRPRPSGFAYSAADFRVMQRDADLALEHGADGIVFGILTAEGQVDGERCRLL